ncbi:hypothetical protein [Streptomyces sp. CAU 1734]|uniref:hypothetical protein n=1 Tax=Streptomyces sp. CAU 1734 TaxID=3140360 RepID=UPI003260F3CE
MAEGDMLWTLHGGERVDVPATVGGIRDALPEDRRREIARDPYGSGSTSYPGGGGRDHRMNRIGGVAVIACQVTKVALLVTVVQPVAR